MNPLHLSGYGIKVKVNDLDHASELEVTNGREDDQHSVTMRFRPRKFPYDSIVIDGHSGYVSLQAFHWLSKHRIPMFILNYNGEVLQSVLPSTVMKPDLRIAQYEAYQNSERRLRIARAIIQGKVSHSVELLEHFNGKYDLNDELRKIQHATLRLSAVRSPREVMQVEALIASHYWHGLVKLPQSILAFEGRLTDHDQYNASDPINAALNYGYALLEGECLKAINEVGLEPSIGFLHDRLSTVQIQTLPSLAYDLMEPFRFLVDLTVFNMFTTGGLKSGDFYFTSDDYKYRFEPKSKQRFIDALREQFDTETRYEGQKVKWASVIQRKTNELRRHLLDPSKPLDFTKPSYLIEKKIVAT